MFCGVTGTSLHSKLNIFKFLHSLRTRVRLSPTLYSRRQQLELASFMTILIVIQHVLLFPASVIGMCHITYLNHQQRVTGVLTTKCSVLIDGHFSFWNVETAYAFRASIFGRIARCVLQTKRQICFILVVLSAVFLTLLCTRAAHYLPVMEMPELL